MVGNNLSRYNLDQKWLAYDIESNGLNLRYNLPWELSYAVATLKGGIQSVHTHMIRWPNYRISDELAIKVHFDRARYEREALPPEEVWGEFSKLLYSPDVRAVGHNLLGFDYAMISTWRAAMGLPDDHSWLYRPLIDTNALAKAYYKGWKPEMENAEAFLAWQYKATEYKETGLKSSLGKMCGEFKIEYDPRVAHSAQYDIERNWLVFKELVWKVEC
jgi:DNA polymerase III alpha subunit (gram-positive type)